MIRRMRRPGMFTRASAMTVVVAWSIVATTAAAAAARDDAPTKAPQEAAIAGELDAVVARAGATRKAWLELFRDMPSPQISNPRLDRRLLHFDSFQSAVFASVTDPREQLACVHAYLAYVTALEKLVEGPLTSLLADMTAVAPAAQRHEPEAVEHFCGELRAREKDVLQRWQSAERSLVSTMASFLGPSGPEIFEEWELDWALSETDHNPLAPPAQIDLAALLTAAAAGQDAEFTTTCAEQLRAYRRAMVRLLKPRFDRVWDATCAFLRQPARFEGETMFVANDLAGPSGAARARLAEIDRACFEALRDALESVATAAGEERGNELRTRFEAQVAPPVHPDPTDLAKFEKSLRESLGDSFDAHEDLQQLFNQTHARRRELCRRMSDAYLQWCWDRIRTGADTDWVKYCDELLARGRDRILLARQTVGIVRNRFLQTPHENMVAALCDARDAELASPQPITPSKWQRVTLDLASPDDAATQLLRQIEARRREWEERRAKQAEKEAKIERARSRQPSAK